MSYTNAQLQAFWFGGTPDDPGSGADIRPGAYVTMTSVQVIELTNTSSASYDADFAAMAGICYQQKLFGWANYTAGAAGNMSYQGRVTGK
jgi:hypothetical protein